MDETKPPGIRIAQIFLARAAFEYTKNPYELPPNTPVGEIDTAVNIQIAMDDAEKAGMVSVTLASTPENAGLYRLLVEMVCIVEQSEDANLSVRDYLMKAGPATVYPFLRETVANITGRGRFGPVWIPPINFTALMKDMVLTKPDSTPEVASKDAK